LPRGNIGGGNLIPYYLQILSGGSWKLVDANLACNELILFPGQALEEASAGYFEVAHHRVVDSVVLGQARFSMAFKC
jgi:isopenicillin N synthase-like dioxygenase